MRVQVLFFSRASISYYIKTCRSDVKQSQRTKCVLFLSEQLQENSSELQKIYHLYHMRLKNKNTYPKTPTK